MTVQDKMVVTIHFTIKDENNELLEVTDLSTPFSYLHGKGTILRGVEQALEGKTVGEEITVILPPQNAFGFRNEELEKVFPLKEFEGDNNEPLQIGESIRLSEEDENDWIVYDIDNDNVYVDGNPRWAGKTLNIAVGIVNIRLASKSEQWQGRILEEPIPDCGPECQCK